MGAKLYWTLVQAGYALWPGFGLQQCRHQNRGRSAIVTAGLFIFLFVWADFVFALTLTPTGKIVPLSSRADALLVLAQRYVAAGLTVGAVKD